MAEQVYHQLCAVLAKRGGLYSGKDIPEFYALIEELFTPEEAAVYMAIPKGSQPAKVIAREMGKKADEIKPILERMASKGVCTAVSINGVTLYGAPLLAPGIFEFQFMRGTKTDRDRKLARLIHAYKAAVEAGQNRVLTDYPTTRVIPVDRTIKVQHAIHTYQQVASYIERYHPLAVSTCFCRHEAKLIDEKDDCGKPDEVCMQFGMGAQFVIERKMGRHQEVKKGSGLALSLAQLLFQPCHSFPEPDVMRRRLLQTRHEDPHAAVIGKVELSCDTCKGFTGQAPAKVKRGMVPPTSRGAPAIAPPLAEAQYHGEGLGDLPHHRPGKHSQLPNKTLLCQGKDLKRIRCRSLLQSILSVQFHSNHPWRLTVAVFPFGNGEQLFSAVEYRSNRRSQSRRAASSLSQLAQIVDRNVG